MMKNELLEQSIRLTYEISGDRNMISVQPFIEADSDRDHTLIVSFEIDSMEMIGSARIPLKQGKNRVPFLQDVRIFHPNLWNPKGCGISSTYMFSAVFYHAGQVSWRIDQEVAICFPVRELGKKYKLNGNPIDLIRFEDDFPFPGSDLTVYSGTGNLILLSDTDPDLEQKLLCCGRYGIMAALKISGSPNNNHLFYPGVCFVTAEPGSEAERYCREICSKGFSSYISLEEIAGLPINYGKESTCHGKAGR